jgi:hypothetical protein
MAETPVCVPDGNKTSSTLHMFYIPMSVCSRSWTMRNLRSNITTLECWLERLSNCCTLYNTGFLVTSFLVVTVEVIWRRRSSISLDLILFYLTESPFRTGARFRETYSDFTFTFIRPTILERMTVEA